MEPKIWCGTTNLGGFSGARPILCCNDILQPAMCSPRWTSIAETQVEPIYNAWLKLSDDARKEMEQDLQEIDELATEGGSKAILDEARWHGEDLAEQFASLTVHALVSRLK
jgi:hypothetical protein